jgi:hypothetical protein
VIANEYLLVPVGFFIVNRTEQEVPLQAALTLELSTMDPPVGATILGKDPSTLIKT